MRKFFFNKSDFPHTDLVKQIHDNKNVFKIKKELIMKHLYINFIEHTSINRLIKAMPSIIDDIDIKVSLVRAVLTSEIRMDEKLEYVYGINDKPNDKDMLIVNVQTRLKKGNIFSDRTINEQLALRIFYR